MKRTILAGLMVLCVFLLPSATLTIKQFEHQIWTLTNQERAKEGLAPLLYDEGLADLSRLHSRNMLNYGFFAHKDHRGLMVDDRKVKYYPQLVVSSIGENLARFFNTAKVYTPREIVTGWMNSPDHRENILDKGYTHLGVGVVTYQDKLIATQNFATPIVKLTSQLPKCFSRHHSHTMQFEYLSPRPKEQLGSILRFPDKTFKYKLDEQYYSLGTKPLEIIWLDDTHLEIKLDFPAGKGKYEIGFGFEGGFYDEGIGIKVK